MAIKFVTPTVETVTQAFASPEGKDTVDHDLVNHIKSLVIGDAIEINFKESGVKTERSLKVRVNKAAKLAKRHFDWRTVDGNFLARVDGYYDAKDNVVDVNPDIVTANGTTEVTVVDTPLQEATTRGRR